MIKNFEQLATSPLRRQALIIAESGYAAINTKNAVENNFLFDNKTQLLNVYGQIFDLSRFKRIICVGFGKAALEAVATIQNTLKDRISCGYVIDLKDGVLGNITCKIGTHPYPTLVNVQATKELMTMLEESGEKDLVICVVSGGGSALLCYPHDMSCETETAIISALTVKGATIQELNTVRKHISEVKGGRLAKIIYPATCISLIFSDVPGDDLGMVASGPTVKDETDNRLAQEILTKYNTLELCQMPSCKLLETPKEDKYFERIHNILFVSGQTAMAAMREKAEDLGFDVKVLTPAFTGEARVLGPEIVLQNKPGQCLLGSGESTVKIIGIGKGGRNQEMALAALPKLTENQVLLCLASDGHDNNEAAGAVVDESVLIKAETLMLESKTYLDNNDSFSFFEATGDLIFTGLTEANISDFFVCVKL
jgi:glycerate 2-kinase